MRTARSAPAPADRLENRYYDPTVTTAADGTYELKFIRPGEHFIQVAPFWAAGQAPREPVASWTSTLVSQRTAWTSGFRIEGEPHRVDPDIDLPTVKPRETIDVGDLLIEKRLSSSRRRRRPRSAMATE